MITTLLIALASTFLGATILGMLYGIFTKLDSPNDKQILKESAREALVYAAVGVIVTIGSVLVFNAVTALAKVAYLIVVSYL